MNTPAFETGRLILRKFTEEDIPALFLILSDGEANTFLPWYPARNVADAETFLRSRFLPEKNAFRAAICLQNDDSLIGYACVSPDEAHDFGYGLRSDQWGKGYGYGSLHGRSAGAPFFPPISFHHRHP